MMAYQSSIISYSGLFILSAGRQPTLGIKVGRNLLLSSIKTHYNDGSKSGEMLTAADRNTILTEITTRKGTLKKSLVSHDTAPRAYYVWRMARFHGGVDTTWPIMATTLTYKEPKEVMNQLDALADEMAKQHFGSHMRAAIQWGRAMGNL